VTPGITRGAVVVAPSGWAKEPAEDTTAAGNRSDAWIRQMPLVGRRCPTGQRSTGEVGVGTDPGSARSSGLGIPDVGVGPTVAAEAAALLARAAAVLLRVAAGVLISGDLHRALFTAARTWASTDEEAHQGADRAEETLAAWLVGTGAAPRAETISRTLRGWMCRQDITSAVAALLAAGRPR